jgi:adenine-specific DNA glycosylase
VENIRAWGALFVVDGLYLLRRRPDRGLWAGFWEIPWFARETENARSELDAWGRSIGLECLSCREVGTTRFSFTNHRVTAWFVICEGTPAPKIRSGEWGLHKPEALSSLALPAPSRKFLDLLQRSFHAAHHRIHG